jgi:hypothetical protein
LYRQSSRLAGPRRRRHSRHLSGSGAAGPGAAGGSSSTSGSDTAGRALWALTIDGDDLPGRWIVIDREFHPVA